MISREDKAGELIERLAANEEGVAGLYRAYSDAFPNLREFWFSLVTDEFRHASWIRGLGSARYGQCIVVDSNRFNQTAVQTFKEYVDGEREKAMTRRVPLIEALSVAFYIEQSLIESKFFDIFKTDSAEILNILGKIRDDTAAHRSKAKQELEKHKSGFRPPLP